MDAPQTSVRSYFAVVGDLLKRAFQFIASEPVQFLRLVIPVLLVFSFLTVLHGWFSLMGTQGINAPVREILTVPLILFGVTAILSVMVFAEKGPSMFLAVFIIGTVVAGAEVVKIGAELTANTFAQGAAMYQGGGVGAQTSNYAVAAGGVESAAGATGNGAGETPAGEPGPATGAGGGDASGHGRPDG